MLLRFKTTYDLFNTHAIPTDPFSSHFPNLLFMISTLIVKLPLQVKALLNISKPLKNNLNILLTFN